MFLDSASVALLRFEGEMLGEGQFMQAINLLLLVCIKGFGPQVESLVSLIWCIRQGTRGEGDGDADYLPPPKP